MASEANPIYSGSKFPKLGAERPLSPPLGRGSEVDRLLEAVLRPLLLLREDRHPVPHWMWSRLRTEPSSGTDPQASVSETTSVLACSVVTFPLATRPGTWRESGCVPGQHPAPWERGFTRELAQGDRGQCQEGRRVFSGAGTSSCRGTAAPQLVLGDQLLPSFQPLQALGCLWSAPRALPGLHP